MATSFSRAARAGNVRQPVNQTCSAFRRPTPCSLCWHASQRDARPSLCSPSPPRCGGGTVGAQQKSNDRDFSWDGKITNGRWLYVRDLNGSIRVEKATGDRAEVTAVKRWRRGNPEDVRIETRRLGGDDGDVIICAFWTDNASCDEEGYRSKGDNNWHGHDNDTSVEFTVKLPAGVRLGVSTVNGGVTVERRHERGARELGERPRLRDVVGRTRERVDGQRRH